MAVRTLLLVALLATSPTLVAEPPAPLAAGTHFVRPGDTLEDLAILYFGSNERWQEIWRLNPQVKNPHLLQPGEPIRMPPATGGERPVGQIAKVSRSVDAQPVPLPWRPAGVTDLLVENDGIRTARKASSLLRFTDGSDLTLTEESLVFIRRQGARKEAAAPREVEIVTGQADLAASPVANALPSPPIEIVIGPARAKPRAGAGGRLETRARKAEAGDAQVMLYRGESTVEAAGAAVALAPGTGTRVVVGQPPTPPEPLPSAPALLAPPPGATIDCGAPRLAWSAVAGAVSYVLELCTDAGCGALVERKLGLTATSEQPTLPVGDYYWRVTARTASGLDGFPSTARALTISETKPVAAGKPDELRLALTGERVRAGDWLFVLPSASATLRLADDTEADPAWTVLNHGQPVPRSQLAGPWPSGLQALSARLADLCGRELESATFRFVVDGEAPNLRAEAGAAGGGKRQGKADRSGPGELALWWTQDGERWQPLAWNGAAIPVYGPIRLAADSPFTGRAGGSSFAVSRGQALWLSGDDGAGCGLHRFTLRASRGSSGSAATLTADLADHLGNRREVTVEIGP